MSWLSPRAPAWETMSGLKLDSSQQGLKNMRRIGTLCDVLDDGPIRTWKCVLEDSVAVGAEFGCRMTQQIFMQSIGLFSSRPRSISN